ncbi:hypothetical protein VNDN067_22580 [Mycobacterium tuberculosis]|nr:hypothetical protein VNDN049_22480 [Mycobacterium tuberculosis]BCR49420.1 hypothetical protein VNDN059_22540 [Mycobacterium tuberculosis]BCR53468.1 hypothetical protein VNDN067_22580 [Mycobacterium tuberculosis]BCR57515.1 hypothetical protein VNDN068_22540 [Mycobacterium tuberculosis]BCR61553.1 hypothetical protein VNDN101_22550 [Mycobacterium tuberculosis]
MRCGVDVVGAWLCVAVQETDVGAPPLSGVSRLLLRARVPVSLVHVWGLPSQRALLVATLSRKGAGGMHILYERCAFVDVGQDIIAVAVWVPGEGPDGRKTIKRTLCARRSPICSGRWKGASMITMP